MFQRFFFSAFISVPNHKLTSSICSVFYHTHLIICIALSALRQSKMVSVITLNKVLLTLLKVIIELISDKLTIEAR